MQGISTKVTAAALAGAVLTILYYVLFDATWGFEFPPLPDTVEGAVQLLVVFAAGYFTGEKAPNPTVSNGAVQ